MDPSGLQVRHNEKANRFEADLECGHAYVAYRLEGDTLDLRSTWVPRQHREQGIGERIVVHALEHARERDYRVIPTCPFVPWVIDRNPEFRDLVE